MRVGAASLKKESAMSKTRHTKVIPGAIALGLGMAAVVGATDWPQWRGPLHTGVSGETGLAAEWSHDQNVLWRVDLPERSGSTPIISGDRVFLSVAQEDAIELWVLDAGDGKMLYKRQLGTGNYEPRKHNMSSPSPVADGEHVWAMTGTGVIKAFDFAGNERWSRDIQSDYGKFGLNHGYGSSPLLHDGVLYVQVLHGMKTDDPSYVLALDGATGETIWRVERPTDAVMESPDSYTTPLIWTRGGKEELVVTGGDYATGHSLESGEEVWRMGGFNPDNKPMYRVVASPVESDGIVLVSSRVRPFKALVSAEGAPPTVAWELERGTDVPTPAVHEGIVYMVDDRGVAHAYDLASGEVIWGPERLSAGTYSASPTIADGKVYITNEESVTTVMKAGREFGILAENTTEGFTLSSIAVAGGRLYLRTGMHLYCIGS